MRKGFATLAVVGAAACLALYGLTSTQQSGVALYSESDMEFIQFIAKYGKSYASKTEHGKRAAIFNKNL
jgi:hypothetical protein